MKNYYSILGLNTNASLHEIKIAIRKLLSVVHPDKNDNDIFFENFSKEIIEAKNVLLNPHEKLKYDDKLRNSFGNSFSNNEYEKLKRELDEKLEFLNQRENQLNIREQICLNKEKEIESISKERDKNLKSKNKGVFSGFNNPIYTKIMLIFGIIYILFMVKLNTVDSKKLNNELYDKKLEISILNSKNSELQKKFDSLNEIQEKFKIENLNSELNSTSRNTKDNINQKDIFYIYNAQNNNVTIKSEIKIEFIEINLTKEAYNNNYDAKSRITSMSIINHTDKKIRRIKMEYTLKNYSGKPIDSGIVLIECEILPGKAKKCDNFSNNYFPFISNVEKLDIEVLSVS